MHWGCDVGHDVQRVVRVQRAGGIARNMRHGYAMFRGNCMHRKKVDEKLYYIEDEGWEGGSRGRGGLRHRGRGSRNESRGVGRRLDEVQSQRGQRVKEVIIA